MTYGLKIDNDYLRKLPAYKNKTDSQLSSKDRSNVAVDQSNVYKANATKRLDELKEDFGNGVSTLIRIYNASGGRLTFVKSHSWKGHFYKTSPEEYVENGQWTVVMHVKPSVLPEGCAGCVVYRTSENTDVYMGWQNPYTAGYKTSCWAESREKDHWWDKGSKDYMESLLYNTSRASNASNDNTAGFKVTASIGDSTTSYYEVIIEKA